MRDADLMNNGTLDLIAGTSPQLQNPMIIQLRSKMPVWSAAETTLSRNVKALEITDAQY